MSPQDEPALTLGLHARIADIGSEAWDACAGAGNPFVSYAFLSALEDSGSVGGRSGWTPRHATLSDAAGRVLACAPCYVKAHSYGEYVFDMGWADAFERAGGDYYPKLQVAVPFSPVPGPRLLVRAKAGDGAGDGAPILARALGAGLVQATAELGLSSLHVTFCTAAEQALLVAEGCLAREGVQFHWANAGYGCFDDFLAALSSRKRKAIRKERAAVAALGLDLRTLRGAAITPDHWRAFYRFYRNTVDHRWGGAYLSERFFPLLAERLGDRVVLMLAERAGEPVAGALNLLGADALYGRNWGCEGDWPFLHFELCYYRAIEFAIEHRLARVEAGAQGPHKIQRGYMPVRTYSAHWIAHPGLRHAVADFLKRERAGLARQIAEIEAEGPYRRDEGKAAG
ncbi:MAG: N-acetyltransferase [Alphaproteobacteria bacterium]|nr:N-acetyltransferase [Alphaproteobacteria bacterium]